MKEYYDAYLWGLIIGWGSMVILALLIWAVKTKEIMRLRKELNDLNKHLVTQQRGQLVDFIKWFRYSDSDSDANSLVDFYESYKSTNSG